MKHFFAPTTECQVGLVKASDELSKNFDVLFLRLCCYKEVVDVHENGFPFQIADDSIRSMWRFSNP